MPLSLPPSGIAMYLESDSGSYPSSASRQLGMGTGYFIYWASVYLL